MTARAYDELERHCVARCIASQHLASIAWWDQAAMMPPKGNEARAAAMAEMDALLHRTAHRPAPGRR